ncbi:MAG: sugar transporter [Prevotella sp.]|nr:sugar transporter [Prevotella sp.]
MSERVHRSVMNIKVGMFFYVLSLFLAFFSRKVFLNCLGAEFIGLTGMLMNIMSFLSVAELGIGTSIVYFLYKPLQENNHEKINEIMSMLAFLYRCIGGIIGIGGLVVSLFFPWWFRNLSTGLPLVYFAFYSFLATAMVGYIFNYRQLLVSANQRQYVVNAYFQSIAIIQSVAQIILAYYYRNLWLWVVVGLVFTIIGCIVFNYRIRKEYPWLRISLREGKANLKKYPEVLRKTRQIFVQRIKDFILYRSDEILVGTFVSVVQVAFYGNYTIITSKLNFLVNILSDGMNAGIGNLVAEGDDEHTMKVFWELTAIRFLIVGMVVFGLLLFIQPFITCWFGAQYRLSDLIVYLLIFNIFIMLSRGVVEMYISAHGLFSDVWAAWTELAVNLTVTLCLAPFYGIVGILLGKIVSVFFIAMFWKPYFLFSRGLHKSVMVYWRGMLPYYTIFAVFIAITLLLRYTVMEPKATSMLSMIGYGLLIYIPLLLIYFLTYFYTTKGMRYFIARKPALYNKLIRF